VNGLVDRRPPAWLSAVFRAPAILFRLGMGWLFFGRLLLLTHVGRRTGRDRSTVLEVVLHERQVWYVAAAWGEKADWYRNVRVNPQVVVWVGVKRYPAIATTVDVDEAARILERYVRDHPIAARFVGHTLGIDLIESDPRMLAQRIPLVSLTAEDPAEGSVAPVHTTREETRATYDRIAPVYEILEGFWERSAREVGLEALAPRYDEHVLDVGCGPGHSMGQIAEAVGVGGLVIGVDLSSEMCALARRRVERREHLMAAVVQADAVRMPFADDSFDAGFMSFTLELFDTPDIPIVLDECMRVIRPGGRLVVVSLDKRHPAPLMQEIYEWGHERFPHVLDCRPIHVASSLAEAGYSVSSVRHLSLWGLPVDVAVAGNPPDGVRRT
jgi:demethylmenaquinone methyltransferase/2-methoxy-6-polyprenyl-1,4-benzoquinol methylase